MYVQICESIQPESPDLSPPPLYMGLFYQHTGNWFSIRLVLAVFTAVTGFREGLGFRVIISLCVSEHDGITIYTI